MRHPSLAEHVEAALAHNLALLRWVAQRVREAGTGQRRAQFFREFGRVLDGRLCAMELVVMPELKARGCRCEVSMGVFVHVFLRPELGEMLQQDMTLAGFEGRDDLLARLGAHRTGKVCVYIRLLANVDLKVLETMVARSVAATQRRYPPPS